MGDVAGFCRGKPCLISLLELFEGVGKQVVNLDQILKWHFQRDFESSLQGSVVSLSCQRTRGKKFAQLIE